ncbi:hypothetical protein AYI68_g2487 [Smittium mucronatum]|uniref:Uncharacterized protein n=1 Tax=Smittium mucronatum TaxID=133383 RepID=A0A1R0H2I6_9FUNG|nr:hypothetical protein AYI68_g2487 [Smittium mucronatum]
MDDFENFDIDLEEIDHLENFFNEPNSLIRLSIPQNNIVTPNNIMELSEKKKDLLIVPLKRGLENLGPDNFSVPDPVKNESILSIFKSYNKRNNFKLSNTPLDVRQASTAIKDQIIANSSLHKTTEKYEIPNKFT